MDRSTSSRSRAHKTYKLTFNAALLGWFGSVQQCLKYGSAKTRDLIVTSSVMQTASTAARLTERMVWATDESTTTPPACLITLSCPAGNHCIAAIEEAGTWSVFDPNYGVMIVDIGAGQALGNLMADIWSAYRITIASAAPVA